MKDFVLVVMVGGIVWLTPLSDVRQPTKAEWGPQKETHTSAGRPVLDSVARMRERERTGSDRCCWETWMNGDVQKNKNRFVIHTIHKNHLQMS